MFKFLHQENEKKEKKGNIEFSFSGLFKCMLCTHETEKPEEKQLSQIMETLKILNTRFDALEK